MEKLRCSIQYAPYVYMVFLNVNHPSVPARFGRLCAKGRRSGADAITIYVINSSKHDVSTLTHWHEDGGYRASGLSEILRGKLGLGQVHWQRGWTPSSLH
jgi:hypothetical protein